MRYFLNLSYSGKDFCGWQIQPDSPSVQQTLQEVLSKLFAESVAVTGCGRTDTGVHASEYFAHFDLTKEIEDCPHSIYKLNAMLPPSIAIYELFRVKDEAHSRFDAYERSYIYNVHGYKNPFIRDVSTYYRLFDRLDRHKMDLAAAELLNYNEFYPFCKTHSGANHYRCDIKACRWVYDDQTQKHALHITADRFLRGMVRLITGMCFNVGLGKTSLDDLRKSLDEQKPLPKSYSAEAQGLFLSSVKYDMNKIKY